MWAPDVYEGAPTPVTGFHGRRREGRGLRGPAARAADRLRRTRPRRTGGPGARSWRCWRSLTMLGGNLLAVSAAQREAHARLLEHRPRRLPPRGRRRRRACRSRAERRSPACSSTWPPTPPPTAGAFAGLAALERLGGNDPQPWDLDRFAGLAKRRPWAAAAIALLMLSLAGIPPTAGFMGKLLVFRAAVDAGLVPLAVIGMLSLGDGPLLLPARGWGDVHAAHARGGAVGARRTGRWTSRWRGRHWSRCWLASDRGGCRGRSGGSDRAGGRVEGRGRGSRHSAFKCRRDRWTAAPPSGYAACAMSDPPEFEDDRTQIRGVQQFATPGRRAARTRISSSSAARPSARCSSSMPGEMVIGRSERGPDPPRGRRRLAPARQGRARRRRARCASSTWQSTNGTFCDGVRVEQPRPQGRRQNPDRLATILKFTYQDDLDEVFQQPDLRERRCATASPSSSTRSSSPTASRRVHLRLRHAAADAGDVRRRPLQEGQRHLRPPGRRLRARPSSRHVLARRIRTEDIFARYGGEEFALICRECPEQKGLLMGERIRSSSRNPSSPSGTSKFRSPSASASLACPRETTPGPTS